MGRSKVGRDWLAVAGVQAMSLRERVVDGRTSLSSGLRRLEEKAHHRLEEAVGSASDVAVDAATVRVRVQFVVVFAAVYGLADADTTTIGTAATQLSHSLRLSNFQLGTLVAVGTAVGALTTLPSGALADKLKRVPLLAWSVALWALAMALSAAASSYGMLLATRVLLGGLLAVNGPVTASLLGDLWPAPERGRIYGLITSGELVGAGLGFFVSGELAAVSWRLSFLVLGLPAVLIAWRTSRLPEPERALRKMSSAMGEQLGSRVPRPAVEPTGKELSDERSRTLRDSEMSSGGFWQVVGYVLSIRTNVILVVAGGLTWMFLSAVESFGEEFTKEQYHVGQVLATVVLLVVGVGAVAGATVGGQSADELVRRGLKAGRMTVAAVASLVSAVLLVPALLTGDLLVALPLLVVAAGGLAAANPPIDATRIEVVRSSVWGRAEAIRSVLRMGFQAAAPVTVGFVADSLGPGGDNGLQTAFLILVALLLLAGALLLAGHRTYLADRLRALEVDQMSARGAESATGRAPDHGGR